MERNNSIEISLAELYYYVRKRLWIVILMTILAAVATFFVCKNVITPEYTASTRIYVLNKASDGDSVAYSDFQASSQLRKDYQELITGKNVTSEVIEALGLSMSDAGLAKKIHISSPDDTRIIQINVVDESPQMAALIANRVRDVARRQIVEIMAIDAVNVVYEASVPTVPSSPHSARDTVIAAMLTALVMLVLVVIFFLVDDRIKTEEDVERYLGLSTIGVIPMSSSLSKRDYHNEKNGKKKKK